LNKWSRLFFSSFNRASQRSSLRLSTTFSGRQVKHGMKIPAFMALTTGSCCLAFAAEEKTPKGSAPPATKSDEKSREEYDPYTIVIKSRTITALITELRDKETGSEKFALYANRLLRILAEEALGELAKPKRVQTPLGPADGLELPDSNTLCGVSIIRSGDILLEQLRIIAPAMSVGKILIQRDNSDPEKRPMLYYSKLPKDIHKKKTVILVDPMLGTAGSSTAAIKVLEQAGVKPENILFINVIACPEGIARLHQAYPKVKIVTCAIDPKMNDDKYIVPGLGDFVDRYYGTEH